MSVLGVVSQDCVGLEGQEVDRCLTHDCPSQSAELEALSDNRPVVYKLSVCEVGKVGPKPWFMCRWGRGVSWAVGSPQASAV